MWISVTLYEVFVMKLLRIEDVINITGFGSSFIYSKIQSGEFPKPIKIGRSSRWIENEVHAWNESHINRTREENKL